MLDVAQLVVLRDVVKRGNGFQMPGVCGVLLDRARQAIVAVVAVGLVPGAT